MSRNSNSSVRTVTGGQLLNLFREKCDLESSNSSSSGKTKNWWPATNPLRQESSLVARISSPIVRTVTWWQQLIHFRHDSDLVVTNSSSSARTVPSCPAALTPQYVNCPGIQIYILFIETSVLVTNNSYSSDKLVTLWPATHPLPVSKVPCLPGFHSL